jgi:hypothetical protein
MILPFVPFPGENDGKADKRRMAVCEFTAVQFSVIAALWPGSVYKSAGTVLQYRSSEAILKVK